MKKTLFILWFVAQGAILFAQNTQDKMCFKFLPSITYEVNDFRRPVDSRLPELNLFDVYADVILNSTGNFQITGFCTNAELPKMAEKRVNYFRKQLQERGVPVNRLTVKFNSASVLAKDFTGPSMQDKDQFTSNQVVLVGVIR